MDLPASSSQRAKRKSNLTLALPSPSPSKRTKHEPSPASASSKRTPTSTSISSMWAKRQASTQASTPTSAVRIKSSRTSTPSSSLQGTPNNQNKLHAMETNGHLCSGDVPEIFRGKSDKEIAKLMFQNPTGECFNFTTLNPAAMKSCIAKERKQRDDEHSRIELFEVRITTLEKSIANSKEHQKDLYEALRNVQTKLDVAEAQERNLVQEAEGERSAMAVLVNRRNLWLARDQFVVRINLRPYQHYSSSQAQEIVGVSSYVDLKGKTKAEIGGRLRLLKNNGYEDSNDFRRQFKNPESDFCKRNGHEPRILIDASGKQSVTRLKIRLCDALGILDIPQAKLDKYCSLTEPESESKSRRLTVDLELEVVSEKDNKDFGEEDGHAPASPVAHNPFDGMSQDELAFFQQKLDAAARNKAARNSSSTN